MARAAHDGGRALLRQIADREREFDVPRNRMRTIGIPTDETPVSAVPPERITVSGRKGPFCHQPHMACGGLLGAPRRSLTSPCPGLGRSAPEPQPFGSPEEARRDLRACLLTPLQTWAVCVVRKGAGHGAKVAPRSDRLRFSECLHGWLAV